GPSPPPHLLAAEFVRKAAYGSRSAILQIFFYFIISQILDEDVRHFAATHMVASNTVLYGVNFELDELCAFGKAHVPASEEPAPRATASPYVGGEFRREARIEEAYVYVGGEGAALDDVPANAVQVVLMAWLGSCVWAPGRAAIGKGTLEGIAKQHSPSTVNCAAIQFEGEGLIQFYVEAPPSRVRDVVQDVVNLLKNFKIDNLEDSKQRAKETLIRADATRHPIGTAVIRSKEILAGVEKNAVIEAIDNVTTSQLEAAVRRILSNITIASLGNSDNIPSRSEIHNWIR
ncbi:hypothetical protein PMAYCL1PPCAC_20436, partial [Pristionchus mayeri]